MMATTTDISVAIQHLDKTLHVVAERDAKIFNKYFDRSDPTKGEEFAYTDKRLVSYKDELVTAITSTGQTTIRVSSSAANGFRRFVAADGDNTIFTITNENGTEFIEVTAITQADTYADLTVSRAARGTTAITAKKGTQVIILPATPKEGSEVTGDYTQQSIERKNLIQTFLFPIIMTVRAQSVETISNELNIAKQLMDGQKEIPKMIQQAFFHGQKWTGGSGVNKKTESGGLRWFASEAGNHKHMAGKKLGYDLMNGVIKDMLDAGAKAENIVLFLPFRQQEALNQLKENRIIGGGQGQKENTLDNYVEFYRFGSNASVKVWYCHELAEDEVFFADDSKLSIRPLNSGQFLKEREQGIKGFVDRKFMYADAGFQVLNPNECLHHFTGLDVGGAA